MWLWGAEPMYLTFYGLNEKPFNTTPDPKFLYLTPGHREALAQLVYSVRENRGFLVLTGEALLVGVADVSTKAPDGVGGVCADCLGRVGRALADVFRCRGDLVRPLGGSAGCALGDSLGRRVCRAPLA